MEHGVTAEAFSDERLSMVTRILQESYKAGGGITGFGRLCLLARRDTILTRSQSSSINRRRRRQCHVHHCTKSSRSASFSC